MNLLEKRENEGVRKSSFLPKSDRFLFICPKAFRDERPWPQGACVHRRFISKTALLVGDGVRKSSKSGFRERLAPASLKRQRCGIP
jgi:hypothetical protein